MAVYNYTKEVNVSRLQTEIEDSAIVTALDYINLEGADDLEIVFKASLSSGDETLLDGIVEDHVNEPLPEGPQLVQIDGPLDSDGSPMTRLKMFKTGVAVRFHFISFKTSDIGSLKHRKHDGSTSFGFSTYKIYDGSNAEITDPANEGNAVKTVVDFEPPSIDYEIIGGKFYQNAPPASDVFVHVVGVPDVPEAYGGSVGFCSDANLKLMGSGLAFETDGRVPKLMRYHASNHTSKLRFIFYHSAGTQHECMAHLEVAY